MRAQSHFGQRVRVLGLIVASAALMPASATFAVESAGPLIAPSGEVLCLLYYKVAGTPAPLDDFAAQAAAVKKANEFDRAKAIATEKSRLEALEATLQQVSSVRLNLDMSMGEYDASLGEYDLSGFGADQYYPFDCFGLRQLHLRLDNAAYAQSWTLASDAAQAALTRNEGQRDITAVTTIDLTGTDPTSPTDPAVLVGVVRSVAVEGEWNHRPLGHYDVKSN